MSDSGDAPPPFENPFDTARSAEERVYDTVLQTRQPTTATEMADDADCDPKTARKYLDWFGTLGVVTKYDGDRRPTSAIIGTSSGGGSTSWQANRLQSYNRRYGR